MLNQKSTENIKEVLPSGLQFISLQGGGYFALFFSGNLSSCFYLIKIKL